MSKRRNTLFLILFQLIKYSIIFFSIIPLTKVKCGSEIRLTMKNIKDEDHQIVSDKFYKTPSNIKIDNNNKGAGKKFKLDWAGSHDIIITFNEDINSCENMFREIWGIEEIIIKSFTNLKPVSMANMFSSTDSYGNNPLKKVVFENIDTSSVTDMSNIFLYAKKLEEVDLSKFNTASVKNMNSFFAYCLNLKSVNLFNFNTASVTDMGKLFLNCTSLQKLNLSNFNTASVTNMGGFFWNCTNLEEVDISSFNTASVTDMSHFFEYCTKLKEIDLSNFNTASVTTMHSMFRHCETLKVIDARSFDTSQVTNMYDIFGYCYQLEYLNVNSFNTAKVQVMQGMFISCNLKYLDLSHFDYTAMISNKGSCNNKECRFHCTFSYLKNLVCLNIESIYIDEALIYTKIDNNVDNEDKPFWDINSNIKYCVNPDNIKHSKVSLENKCSDPCFGEMSKKFDIKENKYVDNCGTSQFDYNDICWEGCPYHYYSEIIDGKKTCSKQAPGEHFFLDSEGIYEQCYSTCNSCKGKGTESSHNCNDCASGFMFISNSEDEHATPNNCYKKCEKKEMYR